MVMPLWNPLIPPLGISCLKSYLQEHGYSVYTADANVHPELNRIISEYFEVLGGWIPKEDSGNFNNIANTVLEKHLMVHRRQSDETKYLECMREVIYQAFFQTFSDARIARLSGLIVTFYDELRRYLTGLLTEVKPTVVGASVYGATVAASLFAFDFVKEFDPSIRTVMGGGIFSGEMAPGSPNFDYFTANTPQIDCVIMGEGERLFLHYLQGTFPEGKKVVTLEDISGSTLDLDAVPVPDFSDFDLRYYPNLASYSSRSCPFNCSFCSEVVLWGKYRKKRGCQVVRELETLISRYGRQLFLLSDSLLNPIVTDLAEECIAAGIYPYWDGYLRADKAVCQRDNTILWRQGGFYRARLGLESGSEKILQAMDKRITPERIRSAVSNLAYAGIKTTTYWIVGYPGETEEDFQATLDLIEEMKDDIYEADCNPFEYFLSGQKHSDNWNRTHTHSPLYPEWATDMLMIRTWVLDCRPDRQEMFRRLSRFTLHCRRLGIPNPYSKYDIYHADQRWKKLHQNAVPSLVEFESSTEPLTECRNVQSLLDVEPLVEGDGDFDF